MSDLKGGLAKLIATGAIAAADSTTTVVEEPKRQRAQKPKPSAVKAAKKAKAAAPVKEQKESVQAPKPVLATSCDNPVGPKQDRRRPAARKRTVVTSTRKHSLLFLGRVRFKLPAKLDVKKGRAKIKVSDDVLMTVIGKGLKPDTFVEGTIAIEGDLESNEVRSVELNVTPGNPARVGFYRVDLAGARWNGKSSTTPISIVTLGETKKPAAAVEEPLQIAA